MPPTAPRSPPIVRRWKPISASPIKARAAAPGPTRPLRSRRHRICACYFDAKESALRVMIRTIAICGYRSLRDVRLSLASLNVVTGANGVGKSSLYRAIRLLADIAQGRIIQSLAAEGGLHSTLWAGPEQFSRGMKQGRVPVQGTVRKASISLKLGFSGDDYGYAIDLGLPTPSSSQFSRDPAIKTENQWNGETLTRTNVFAVRNGPSVRIRDSGG